MDQPINSRQLAAALGRPARTEQRSAQRLGLGHFSLDRMRLDAANSALAAMLGYDDKRQCCELFKPLPHNLKPLFDAVTHQAARGDTTRFSNELPLRRTDSTTSLIRVSVSHDPGNNGLDLAFEDVGHLKACEHACAEAFLGLRHMSGEDFLWGAVRTLSDLFDGAFIGLAVPGSPEGVLSLEAAWMEGEAADGFCYDISGTPCDEVFNKQPKSYCANVSGLFPKDAELQKLNAQAYIGVPLFDEEKNAGGVLYLVSATPINDDRPIKTALMAYAERAGLELARQRSEHRLQNVWRKTVKAIAATIEKRDPYTGGHQERTAALVVRIARALNWPETAIEGLEMAALMHDIGKVTVPTEILVKPGALTDVEFALVKGHPEAGCDILKDIDFPWPIAKMVLQHHERMDGTGYPRGLAGDEILPGARLLAIADVVESMSSHRPYRPALGLDAARAEIQRGMGHIYDEAMSRAFLDLPTDTA